jgi:hypothetical protein
VAEYDLREYDRLAVHRADASGNEDLLAFLRIKIVLQTFGRPEIDDVDFTIRTLHFHEGMLRIRPIALAGESADDLARRGHRHSVRRGLQLFVLRLLIRG